MVKLPPRQITLIAIFVIVLPLSGWFIAHCSKRTDEQICEMIRSLRRKGQTDQAWPLVAELGLRSPSDPDSLRLIADVATDVRRLDIASHSLMRLIELDSANRVHYWTQLASLEMLQNRAEAAGSLLDKALTVEPKAVGALRLKAQLLGVVGRSKELSGILLRLVQLGDANRSDLLVLASTDPFVDDIERLEALSKTDPQSADFLLARARQAINADRSDEARQILERFTQARPLDWEGQILSSEEDRAFLLWQRSLPLEADSNSRIWLARGLWLEKRGETRCAARCFREAFELEPELITAASHLGQCIRLNGEPQIAELFSQRAKLLLRVRDLATRIDEQQNLQWAPELIHCLESLGQFWEAWAWANVVSQSAPMDASWKQQAQRLQRLVNKDLLRTDRTKLPARELDWSLVPLPDWPVYAFQESNTITQATPSAIRFTDEAQKAGLCFTYQNKEFPSEDGNLIFESTGGGVAVIDVDADSWPDLFFVQGGSLRPSSSVATSDALFRNRFGIHFDDVTKSAGVQDHVYGQGVAAGDVNNDGFTDLYVANIGENRLLISNGDGTFTDAPQPAFTSEARWTISAAIADVNKDSYPDLFDINYCDGNEPLTTVCVTDQQKPRACRPTIFRPAPDVQFSNNGEGSFSASYLTSDSTAAGGRGMGVVIADMDNDNWLDLFVANDQSPNHLLLNDAKGVELSASFREEGLLRGVGLDRDGFALAFMGIAHGDINKDGQIDLFVTTFSQETPTLFLSQSDGHFSDSTREAGLRAPCFSMLGFGTQFLDADSDSYPELLILNGHIDKFGDSGQQYQMRPQLFRGLPNSEFEEVAAGVAGDFFGQPRLGRSLAVVDWNRDLKVDVVATDLEQPVALATNCSDSKGRSMCLRCIGVISSRDAIGSKVEFASAGGTSQAYQLVAGDGYEASSEKLLQMTNGKQAATATLQVEWPSGAKSRYPEAAMSQSWIAIEGRDSLYDVPR